MARLFLISVDFHAPGVNLLYSFEYGYKLLSCNLLNAANYFVSSFEKRGWNLETVFHL
jgi:hypothetical protein